MKPKAESMGSCYHLIKIESEKSNCFSRILNTIFFKFPFPVISGLSFKLIALENSRGLNCQFDICSCVCMLISFFQKFQSFNSRNLARPYFSLLGNPILHFFLNYLPKYRINEKTLKFCRPHQSLPLLTLTRHQAIGSITSRCTGKEPVLLRRRFFSGRDADQT